MYVIKHNYDLRTCFNALRTLSTHTLNYFILIYVRVVRCLFSISFVSTEERKINRFFSFVVFIVLDIAVFIVVRMC